MTSPTHSLQLVLVAVSRSALLLMSGGYWFVAIRDLEVWRPMKRRKIVHRHRTRLSAWDISSFLDGQCVPSSHPVLSVSHHHKPGTSPPFGRTTRVSSTVWEPVGRSTTDPSELDSTEVHRLFVLYQPMLLLLFHESFQIY
jgi:hypothetical protein